MRKFKRAKIQKCENTIADAGDFCESSRNARCLRKGRGTVMKYTSMGTICVIVYSLFFVTASKVASQQETDVKSSFEKRVAIFEKFFSSRPKFLEKQTFQKSPTGYIFFWIRYDNCKISYDIRKTDSLVSPYMGYINVDYVDVPSTNCGDYRTSSPSKGEQRYFSTIEAARINRDDDSCYKSDTSRGIKFIFAFQKDTWIFKEALNKFSNNLDPRFAIVLGKSISGRIPVEDNNFWKVLIE
jgi:hypothetical protein